MLDVEAWFKELEQAGLSPASLVYSDNESYTKARAECYRLRKLHIDRCFKVSVRTANDAKLVRVVYSCPKEE